MSAMIPFWSDTEPTIKEILLSVPTTNWKDLSVDDKKRMWRYIGSYFFNPDPYTGTERFSGVRCNYEFYGDSGAENDHLVETISDTIGLLNDRYKRKSYARNFLESHTFDNACLDFYGIFLNEARDVVFEMLTIFANLMVFNDGERLWKKSGEDAKAFNRRKNLEKWVRFNGFSKKLNEILEDFGINYKLTRAGLIAADEPVVVEKIYEPALRKLSSKQWSEVNRDLRDAFQALNKDRDGSGAITHALSGLQAFLQISVHGKTGKGDTGSLINEAIKKKIIPDDDYSKKLIKEMNSFWAKERRDKGDPHPKKAYATKTQAKLVISLIMVFVDHVL